jgi:4-hydroxy-tetrahydrodipicolinate synthase
MKKNAGAPDSVAEPKPIHNRADGFRRFLLKLEGVYSVLPTPFTASGDVDESSLQRVIDLFIDAGVDGVTALGVTGEVARLNESERHRVLEVVTAHVNGRIGVVAGTSAEGTRTCIEYSRIAQAAGATAVMVSPPRMPKLNSDAVVGHFQRLADATDVDIVVQDYPPVSGYPMEPWLLARIAAEIPRARTIKLEDPPTPLKTARILTAIGNHARAASLDVRIFGGLGGVFLLEELMAGATGAMTGFAFPEVLVQIVKSFRAGALDHAADVFYRAVPLMRFEFQEGIGMAIRKEVLHRRGALASPATRAPAAPLDQGTRDALDRVLAWVTRTVRLQPD